ncbi:DUF308 domain-containing protein [Nocardia alba]|uniref:Uncharacterized membrane protein HdeD (DUF308 family) n=1 Tax=Nocardia alba TaxID=225051 RepID=A0A4R1FW42_9NOCA|nr:DUF308 domain-containing protein [Nocardia alba]TCJ96858.1 uncharacterized membrane protein HdeD (DUF308 family) [Nocardia alba]
MTTGADRTDIATLVAGGCSFVLGVALLLWPGRDESTLAVLFGISLLLSTAVQLYLTFMARIAFVLRVLVLVSAGLTGILAGLVFQGGNIELLALWIGIGWSVRGIVHALVAVSDDSVDDGWAHELCGLATMAIGIAIIAITFQTVTGLATMAGSGLVVIGVMELLAGGLGRAALAAARGTATQQHAPTVRAATER